MALMSFLRTILELIIPTSVLLRTGAAAAAAYTLTPECSSSSSRKKTPAPGMQAPALDMQPAAPRGWARLARGGRRLVNAICCIDPDGPQPLAPMFPTIVSYWLQFSLVYTIAVLWHPFGG